MIVFSLFLNLFFTERDCFVIEKRVWKKQMEELNRFKNKFFFWWTEKKKVLGHALLVQVCVVDPHAAPPYWGGVQVALLVPVPQVTEQAPNALKTPSTQNTKKRPRKTCFTNYVNSFQDFCFCVNYEQRLNLLFYHAQAALLDPYNGPKYAHHQLSAHK